MLCTIQVNDTTGVIFARVDPPVRNDPPAGVSFIHYDTDQKQVPLGKIWDAGDGAKTKTGYKE